MKISNRSIGTNANNAEQSLPLSIVTPFYRLTKSNKYCAVYDADFRVPRNRSIDIGSSLLLHTLLEHDIYIQKKVRCCSKHISNNDLKAESIETTKWNKKQYCTLDQEELIDIFNVMKEELGKNCSKLNEVAKESTICYGIVEFKFYIVFLFIQFK